MSEALPAAPVRVAPLASRQAGVGPLEARGSPATRAARGLEGQEPKTPLEVWLVGDSTMQQCSSACPCGWGSRFDQLFDADATVVNRAAGGRSIGTWLYEGAVSSNEDASGECPEISNGTA